MGAALEGKAVVITGAGGGLGRAYALDAAREGAAVVVNDLNPETAQSTVEQIIAAGGRASALAGSTTDEGIGDALVARARSEFGRFDGLVANAGIHLMVPMLEESAESVRRSFDVNVLGTIETGLAAARALKETGGGTIVLITSGTRFGTPSLTTTYGATKGAVASLCWGWALEAAQFGIRVNAISPLAQTAMSKGAPIPSTLGPEVFGPVASYLLSDLSAPLTGQIVRLTESGLSLYPSPTALSAQVEGTEWTAATIAEAIRTRMSHGVADVGLAHDIPAPVLA